jgi:exosortase A
MTSFNTKPLSFNTTNLLKFVVISGCLTFLYLPVIEGLVYDWIHLADFSHGFLVPLVSLYFVYERRKQLSTLSLSHQWKGLGLIILGILLLLIGNLASEHFTMRLSMLIIIGGVILFFLGKEFFKTLLLPVIFLIFMIPLPSILIDQITFPMQLFASKVAVSLLYLAEIPVLREGNVIRLANTALEVAEACSGIRSLVSLVALSVVFAIFTQKRIWCRVFLILSAFPIAIIANAIRVSGTGLLAYHYGEAAADGFFHGFSGWVLFLVAFVCLFGLSNLFSRIK